MLFFLQSPEVANMVRVDRFFARIVKHQMVWGALYCRDYVSQMVPGPGYQRRCVWRMLNGRAAGCEQCLFHMGRTNPGRFAELCKLITAIPGRSKEELMAGYKKWHGARKAAEQQMRVLQA